MKNAFGKEIYEIREIVRDKKIELAIHEMLFSVLRHLGISPGNCNRIINECLKLARNYSSLSEYERSVHNVLWEEGVTKEIPKKLDSRARRIYEQVRPFILDGATLDLGCGDGEVGELLARDGLRVVVADIYKHPNIVKLKLDFRIFGYRQKIPCNDNEFDNTLVLTVFHHSSVVFKSLEEVWRVTKPNGSVVVIESVYGVDGRELPKRKRDRIKHYLSLGSEGQRKVNIFFDHFYNRIIHYSENPKKKVNVPFNFNTSEGWKQVFECSGFRQEKVIHLGVDQPAVPEYHTLHILRVRK